jgi:hypothetical protein
VWLQHTASHSFLYLNTTLEMGIEFGTFPTVGKCVILVNNKCTLNIPWFTSVYMKSPSIYFSVFTRNLTLLDIKIHARRSNVRRMKRKTLSTYLFTRLIYCLPPFPPYFLMARCLIKQNDRFFFSFQIFFHINSASSTKRHLTHPNGHYR